MNSMQIKSEYAIIHCINDDQLNHDKQKQMSYVVKREYIKLSLMIHMFCNWSVPLLDLMMQNALNEFTLSIILFSFLDAFTYSNNR